MTFISSLIIRLAFYLLATAIVIFIIMTGFYRSNWLGLSNVLLLVGTETLLVGSAMLLMLGFSVLLKTVFQQLYGYFSSYASAERHLCSRVLKRENFLKYLAGKKQQRLYFTEFKRKRLLRANNLKHTQQLSKTIRRDLKRISNSISKQTYQHLQKELKAYIRDYDVDSLLKLQQHIIEFM
ncbi:MAG: hypothetical protein ABL903_01230 [Methylococcales bacterium]